MRVGKVEIGEPFANHWVAHDVLRELVDRHWEGMDRDGTRTICATHPDFDEVGENGDIPFYNVIVTADHQERRTRKETWRFERAKPFTGTLRV